jgi:hypothetical protein
MFASADEVSVLNGFSSYYTFLFVLLIQRNVFSFCGETLSVLIVLPVRNLNEHHSFF